MAEINFKQFTLNNEGVRDVNEVLFTTAFKQNSLWNTATMRTGVKDGKALDYVDNMGIVGQAGRGCDPEYTNVDILGYEKKWALGDWSIPKKICYDDLKKTIAEYAMRTGTRAEDIIGTDFYDNILMPLWNKAVTEMYWRMGWFADKAAKNVGDGGTITAGVNVKHFKMADGLFKQIFAIASANSAQHTAIAANREATEAAQKSAIKVQGAALAVIDNLMSDADSRIQENGGRLMITNSLYQALRKDYALRYHETMPFMQMAEGLQIPTYDGVPIVIVSEWDTAIKKYENDGTKLNLPHRAVFASPKNLFIGTEDTDVFAELNATFDDVTRANYFYAASNIGTLVGEDALVQVAY